MGETAQLRLMIGGALGPLAAILYAIGCWHIYLALKPGGKMNLQPEAGELRLTRTKYY